LSSLNLSHNKLVSIPAIGGLTHLITLRLQDNKLQILPDEIGKLLRLQLLHLRANPLQMLPPTIGNLRELCNFELPSAFVFALKSSDNKGNKSICLDEEGTNLFETVIGS
jgi:Leucine-rich repeat (LRR) protein